MDLPAVAKAQILVGLRILQMLSSVSERVGMAFPSILEVLQKVGYSRQAAESGLRCLAMTELIFECERQIVWKKAGTPFEDGDSFIINSAGLYVSQRMLGTYAFRFAEAISDTTDRGRILQGDLDDKKNLLARTHNAFR